MPKIISYTPAWLSRPSGGFDLFSEQSVAAEQKPPVNGADIRESYTGPRRTIARRGIEIFVVVGNTIRWADLCMLKGDWESRRHSKSRRNGSEQTESEDNDILQGAKYKVLKVPIHEQIQQIIPSPNNELLAIVTSNTIHIAVLPSSSHLDQPHIGPIRVKTYILGPTTHVLSQARVMDVLWHPLGVQGGCLVTVTRDAVVRMWELDRGNRWSFDKPTLEVDLRKLHYAKSSQEEVGAADWGTNRGFSIDALGMEVASACFGGTGSEDESGWSSMTLWVAMSEGDVFALCPLLPSKWQPPSTLIPSLTTTIAAKKSYAEEVELPAEEEQIYAAQYQWLADLDRQEPMMVPGQDEFAPEVPIYSRPSILGVMPKLQGPFRIIPGDIEDDLDIAGIHVIASKLDADDLVGTVEEGESFDVSGSNGLSTALVCLMTNTGRLYICLNLNGVEGQWLPLKKPRVVYAPDPDMQPEIVLLEALDTIDVEEEEGFVGELPVFTPDIQSRYAFFITHSRGSYFLSADPWLEALESELQSQGAAGVAFRLGVLMKNSHTLRERMIRFERNDGDSARIAASIVFQDSDLGYFLLTSHNERPYAALLDSPQDNPFQDTQDSPERDSNQDLQAITTTPRAAYEPPATFYNQILLSNFLSTHVSRRHRATLKDEIRLSPSTLEIMTELHRFLSHETHELAKSVAELFSRCERIRTDFSNQLQRVSDISNRVKRINDEDADDFDEEDDRKGKSSTKGNAKIEERLRRIQERQEELVSRHEALKLKTAKLGTRPLSDKEIVWAAELRRLESSLLPPGEGSEQKSSKRTEYWERASEARELARELLAQAKEATAASEESPRSSLSPDRGEKGSTARAGFKVPPDIRKNKVAQVMGLLEKETALVDAAQERLQRLNISTT